MTSWVPNADQSDFTIHHLPFGIFSTQSLPKRVGVAIGDQVIDLVALSSFELLTNWPYDVSVFQSDSLHELMALGKEATSALRSELQMLLDEMNTQLKTFEHRDQILLKQTDVTLHLPIRPANYTDFYSSKEHATNVGKLFRDPENALLPNWPHMPVGYHGRASSIVASGHPIPRPNGQRKAEDSSKGPIFGPTQRLDFELETAFITCKQNALGEPITVAEASDYIWGFTLLNDWSARDIQAWEYVPLGPFLGKSFATSISNWITPIQALEPFRVAGPQQSPKVLPYLQFEGRHHYDISLEAWLITKQGEEKQLCSTNQKHLYWNMLQQLAHQTVNGCNIQVGDVYGSGTISGIEENSYGSLLELTLNGEQPIELESGAQRGFLEDGDTIVLKGFCDNGSIRFGLGEVKGTIQKAVDYAI